MTDSAQGAFAGDGARSPSQQHLSTSLETESCIRWYIEVSAGNLYPAAIQRLFFRNRPAAQRAYERLAEIVRLYAGRNNDRPETIEIQDAYGSAQFRASDLTTIRLLNAAIVRREQLIWHIDDAKARRLAGTPPPDAEAQP